MRIYSLLNSLTKSHSASKETSKLAIWSKTSNFLPDIASIQMGDKPKCKAIKDTDSSTKYHQHDYGRYRQKRATDGIPNIIKTDPSYKYLYDCLKKRFSVEKTSWCKDDDISSRTFIVEKFDLDGINYWCVNFESSSLTKNKILDLKIIVKTPYKLISWVCNEI